jgi:hypothetical protein
MKKQCYALFPCGCPGLKYTKSMIKLDEREKFRNKWSHTTLQHTLAFLRGKILNGYNAFFARCARRERRCLCTTVGMLQLKNRWTDFDKNWYGYCASGGYPKVVLFSYPTVKQLPWRTHQLVRLNRKPLTILWHDDWTPEVCSHILL